jgi:hypothetical protein
MSNTSLFTTIDLYGGISFDYLNPGAWQFSPIAVARSLSKICRYTGHSKEFYSVAQHSVLVSRLVAPEHAYTALFHDAAEIFMGDCNSPLKQLLPDYKALEEKVEKAIFPIIGIPYPAPAAVKMVDIALREHEQRDFMYINTNPLENFPSGYQVPNPIKSLNHEEAFLEFMDRYRELTN